MTQGHALPLATTLLLSCSALLSGCKSSEPGDKTDAPTQARNGMVSSAHPLATEAGLEILRQGGNAFDAAVAVAAALNVVEPMMSGMGGYGTILVYSAQDQRIRYLDSSGRIPKAVNSDLYRAPTPDYMQNRRGAKAVSTPGNVKAWEAMSKSYGKLSWADLFAPAIRLAKDGHAIDARLAGSIARAYPNFSPETKAIFSRDGQPLATGETLTQADLANSLGLVAREGAVAFYDGPLGSSIGASMQAAGGFLSVSDLQEHRAEWWDSIHIDYRGMEVHVPSPPANSFPALVRLGMMSRYPKSSMEHNSLLYLHRYAEVTKKGFWDRLRWAGDPDVAPPPLAMLLSHPYWNEEIAKIDDLKAQDFVPPRDFAEVDGNTTHFVVADRMGNVVSATQTLGNAFGSRIMPAGTGIFLNNSLAYCTFEPKGNPMDAHPGRRKLSGDVPAIIMRDGRPWVAIGTPGGHTIPQTVPQMIMNLVDFDMNIKEAVDAGRVSFREPNTLAVESTIPNEIRLELEVMGHDTQQVRALGNAHGLTIEYDAQGLPRLFSGASDPRGAGLAKGY
ncbi:MAG: gamma-glutamyltransferase [Planctomycetota bacterium]|jgi:gamma-glutamyltranspeptidase/glutathione hydrolase